ncbi:hypothetical protein CTRI78_v009618 [Colletotrichum trifolii]|uniref:Uncharacterized protein n=1 Tax=Colletotrichum trifolii TaxID=5466 RepID=A0A4R8QQA1_COLTR|nr:hypothetical protein CTRI78_v009618 [Colletotrichum trifolii]
MVAQVHTLAERQQVYFACGSIFYGPNAQPRKPSKVQNVIVRHKASLGPLVEDLGEAKVVNIIHHLLKDKIFRHEERARAEFPSIFNKTTEGDYKGEVVWKRFDWRCQRIGPNLLHLTNKQMSSEFTAVQYHNTVFVFWSTSEAATWLENIGERNRRRLRRIHIRPERISGSGAGPHGFFDRRARPYDNAMADLISESYLLEELQTGYVYRVRWEKDEDPELVGHDVSMSIARTVFSDFKPLFLARLRSQTPHEVSQLPARLSMMDVQSENPFVSLQAVQERLKVLLRQHLDQPRRIPFRWGQQQSR